jgi:hypothetical protein
MAGRSIGARPLMSLLSMLPRCPYLQSRSWRGVGSGGGSSSSGGGAAGSFSATSHLALTLCRRACWPTIRLGGAPAVAGGTKRGGVAAAAAAAAGGGPRLAIAAWRAGAPGAVRAPPPTGSAAPATAAAAAALSASPAPTGGRCVLGARLGRRGGGGMAGRSALLRCYSRRRHAATSAAPPPQQPRGAPPTSANGEQAVPRGLLRFVPPKIRKLVRAAAQDHELTRHPRPLLGRVRGFCGRSDQYPSAAVLT